MDLDLAGMHSGGHSALQPWSNNVAVLCWCEALNSLDAGGFCQLLQPLHGVVDHEQEVRDALLGLLQQVLEIQKDGLVLNPGGRRVQVVRRVPLSMS